MPPSWSLCFLLVVTLLLLPSGSARRKTRVQNPSYKLNPNQLEEAATAAAGNVVMWGSQTLFGLKTSSQIKKKLEGPNATNTKQIEGDILPASFGNVFLLVNSPMFGKIADTVKRCIEDSRRRTNIMALSARLQRSQALGGKEGVMRDMQGFWEAALSDEELSKAHDSFVADLQV
ncbi:unnamed protein product [Choristocarpus tenellus]